MASAVTVLCAAAVLLSLWPSDGVTAAPASDRVTSIPRYGPLRSAYYAGYLNATDARRAFYVFIESEGSPSADPLVLWLNGGPGCSSLMGLFEEHGPYTMRHGGQFVYNAFNFPQLANVIYLESPGDVGFSTDVAANNTVWDDELTVKFNVAALKSFFELFPEFSSHDFYIAGESYAGFYVPELVHRLKLTEAAPEIGLRLKGFMVGNPCTGDIGCGNPDPTLNPFLQYNGFMAMDPSIPTDPNANYDPCDVLAPTCDADSMFSRVQFSHPVLDALRKRSGRGPLGDLPAVYGPCADDHVRHWMNHEGPAVKEALHANTSVHWYSCNMWMNYTTNMNGVMPLYRDLMDHTNVSIMIYSGLDDTIVNQAQTQTLVNDFGRPLVKNQFQAWYLPDLYNASQQQLGGFFLQYDRIAWAGVRNSGHMVPQYNPPAGLELFKSFLALGRPGRLHD